MRLSRIEGPITVGLLLLAPFLVRASSPAVSVGLKASWNAAPFLLELLETAADENSTSYFPLLDRISTGALAGKTTDEDLYTSFLALANAEGFLTDPVELASFNLALSIHAAAPRIQAHYHYYTENLEHLMGQRYKPECKVWVQWASKQMCKLDGDFHDMKVGTERYPNDRRKLPFERVLETAEDKPVAILYADIQAAEFKGHHERLKRYAEEGHISYRVRYRPPIDSEERPVMLSGYGVQLVLKKTDYMVMDDREVEGDAKDSASKGDSSQQPVGQLEDEETQDIKPLQGKDLAGLGYKAASFVMKSENPFDTLIRLLQDFPKHSATIASGEADTDIVKELRDNWEMTVGPGKNLLWINGLQIDYSQVNIFALLEQLRRERNFIKGLTNLGLNSSEAIQLLSHKALTEAAAEDKPQRFDYRDTTEGGNVIIWLNDLETDSRYSDFTTNVNMLLRRIYPGQLHPIRKNIHNMVWPMDFTSKDDLTMVAHNLRMLIDRKIAIRFGLVPVAETQEQVDRAKTVYHLLETHGLESVLAYVEHSLDKDDFSTPSQKSLDAARKGFNLKEDKTPLDVEAIILDVNLEQRVSKAKDWAERLGTNPPNSIFFINGHTVPKNDEWAQGMSQKLQGDVMFAQQYAYEQHADDSTDFSAAFLEGSAKRRSSVIFPEDNADIKHIDIAATLNSHKNVFEKLPVIQSDTPNTLSETSVWVVGDFDEKDGYELLQGAVELQKNTPGVNLVLINNPQLITGKPTLSTLLHQLQQVGFLVPKTLQQVLDEVRPTTETDAIPKVETVMEGTVRFSKEETWSYPDHIESGKFWNHAQKILKDTGLAPGQRGLIVNGRIVGPIPQKEKFVVADFDQLLEYEHAARIKPVLQAVEELGVVGKIKDGSFGLATLTNQVALTMVPGTPASYLEDTILTRMNVLEKIELGDKYTSFSTGEKDNSSIQVLAIIDPASETAQKWVPLLKVLSEMSGVHLKVFLNPARLIQKLPVKRFYRQVLNKALDFDKSGRAIEPRARFENVPELPLLSFSMDVPPSWLVTPKESLHDLDNLKLESLKERLQGSDVEALYELENILIEGHSSDTEGRPPRGVQLVLGTEKNPHFDDTIIMANLGYFQFKANPGLWNLELKEGRSQEIWNMDAIGSKGLRGKAEDEDPQVMLMSFQGATLFPKFSRKPGMENEDVLEPATGGKTPVEKAKKWLKKAENFLSDFGGTNTPTEVAPKQQAEINIFSVASGHLYERFLNIMMLSVMKNTDKTVKFWFIENFLSPSFKDFIPIMAKEYNFEYELVTYKWPHWLRAQTEKQREIWGYKILFLDVLFPLDLDKVIFVDADQIVRTDLKELVDHDLGDAVYGFTPMCDSREEIEGFRFWKQGYWKNFLQGLPYHISALYVVDLKKFRQLAAGDKLRQQYHQLSADENSLSNLDQDLPNHMQSVLPIHSLPQDWLWCETWCSDESLKTAKTIDLCNNPMTKEPKLDRARRQVPEWTAYDNEVALLAKRTLKKENGETVGHLTDAVKDEEKKEQEEEEQKRKEAEKEAVVKEDILEETMEILKDEL